MNGESEVIDRSVRMVEIYLYTGMIFLFCENFQFVFLPSIMNISEHVKKDRCEDSILQIYSINS